MPDALDARTFEAGGREDQAPGDVRQRRAWSSTNYRPVFPPNPETWSKIVMMMTNVQNTAHDLEAAGADPKLAAAIAKAIRRR